MSADDAVPGGAVKAARRCRHGHPQVHSAPSHRSKQNLAVRRPVKAEPSRRGRVRSPHRLRLEQAIRDMHEIIYLIGLVVVVLFILGLLGVR